MDQKKFDNLSPGDLVGFKHKKETIGFVTRTRLVTREILETYLEVTINWHDEDGTFIGVALSKDCKQLTIIVKAKNDRKYF